MNEKSNLVNKLYNILYDNYIQQERFPFKSAKLCVQLTLLALKQVLSGCISNTEISRAGI